jgi:hypothetical protein
MLQVLLVVVTIATVGALVWLPAWFGFAAAVGLASLWCWLLDRRPEPQQTAPTPGNI